MFNYKFVFIIVIFLILLFIKSEPDPYPNSYPNENFINCVNIPEGPYITKCTNITWDDNILIALCPSNLEPSKYKSTKLYLDNCGSNSDCSSINIDLEGNLICN